MKRSLHGRGLYAISPDQIKSYILTNFTKQAIGLSNVDNTADVNKPLSTAALSALSKKLDKTAPYVQSINGTIGNIVIDKSTLSLSNVDNTSDINKPISALTQSALDKKVETSTFNTYKSSIDASLATKIDKSSIAISNGLATLDSDKLVPLTQIPILDKSKVNSSKTADTFSTPVVINYKTDITGNVTINGSQSSLDCNLTLSNTGVTAAKYGDALSTPSITVDSKGRITSASTVSIQSSTTNQAGVVQLNSSVSSNSTTEAATPSAVKAAYDLAYLANSQSIPLSQKGSVNGVATLDASGKIPTSQLPSSGALVAVKLDSPKTISGTGDASFTVNFDGSANVSSPIVLTNVLNSPGTYGLGNKVPTFTVNSKGQITSIASVDITPSFSNISNKPTTAAGYGISDVYTKAEVEDLLKRFANLTTPVGTIFFYSNRNEPEGAFFCDGRAISRTTYSNLFSVIGTTFGAGDGSTTFNIPDFRGDFIRVWNGSKGSGDVNRVFASWQGDAIRNITGEIVASDDNALDPNATKGAFYTTNRTSGTDNGGKSIQPIVAFDASRVVPTANENRPRNSALLFCIKY